MACMYLAAEARAALGAALAITPGTKLVRPACVTPDFDALDTLLGAARLTSLAAVVLVIVSTFRI